MTEGDLTKWITGWGTDALANNTVRVRLSTARTFLNWCLRTGHVPADLTVHLGHIARQYPKTYGKKQGKHPARFLTYEQAFGELVPACSDGTWKGSRDHLAIRLGLTGLRAAELVRLTIGSLHPDGSIVVMGKGRKVRTIIPGPTLRSLLDRWLAKYQREVGRPLTDGDPLLCAAIAGNYGSGRLHWGKPLAYRTFAEIVHDRAETAGLGWVAPHDLRRTAAAILHKSKTADGGHLYDLLDIQQVLDHADPATTQRSYLDQIDTDTKRKAGGTLD